VINEPRWPPPEIVPDLDKSTTLSAPSGVGRVNWRRFTQCHPYTAGGALSSFSDHYSCEMPTCEEDYEI
jgi:hypothetical protein